MTTFFTLYVLIWPALTLGVLIVICRAVLRDRREARRQRKQLV
ncbi:MULTISPECIES: putative transporter small subunit [Modicisalibacter]|uniref:Transporter small subunit n=1 Tax=Modicisalibacter tunisiensis TaxID=390637 RepID=A0ABS7X4U5_9GAMM|nr:MULTISPECIES: putative transporter small subunit [Modicisalibacter]MBZ9537530.1 putative transporter small subunit [Modicisalibacter tunisiensis]MBZ9569047.1 putative transporter small subunit [Modicisalibacter tunisiensis]